MEVDKDHIHYMIETTPNINLSNLVRTMKSYITYHMWEKYPAYLSKCFWKEKKPFSLMDISSVLSVMLVEKP